MPYLCVICVTKVPDVEGNDGNLEDPKHPVSNMDDIFRLF